jgi:hypothetical protein
LAVYAGRLKQQNPAVLEATYQYYAPMFSFPPRLIREGVRNAFEMVSERNPDIKGKRVPSAGNFSRRDR